MMKIAYFDCFSGASGDMILGALLDAGLSLEDLRRELARLPIRDYSIQEEAVTRGGIAGRQVSVVSGESHQHAHRHLRDLEAIVTGSTLSGAIQEKCLSIFRRLAEAEARVHRVSPDAVHFHEIGALDTIVDIVGSVVGLELLGIERIHCSPLNVGGGTVKCAHGELPVPAPATAQLVLGKPLYSSGVNAELLTPTGAVILTSLASEFGPYPPMTLLSIGYGAGRHDLPFPNLLRLAIGECGPEAVGLDQDSVVVIEANIDDMNPQIYDFMMERLLASGALDVTLTPLQMKKNRPATLVSVVCPIPEREACANILLEETTTIGVRWFLCRRIKAHRTFREVATSLGPVRCKVAFGLNGVLNVTPEYEDCKRLARANRVPLKQVMDEVRCLAHRDLSS
jgi:hypothetical protein